MSTWIPDTWTAGSSAIPCYNTSQGININGCRFHPLAFQGHRKGCYNCEKGAGRMGR